MGQTPNKKSQDDLKSNFRNMAAAVSGMFAAEGLSIKPYSTPDLSHFSALNSDQKAKACHDLSMYLGCIQAAAADDISLRDENWSLWSALKYFGFRPTEDIFDRITNDVSVEVIDFSGIQLWRNFRFMEVCSYTIEEIFVYSWVDRYTRDEVAAKAAAEAVGSLKVIQPPRTVECNIKNVLAETLSEKRYVIDVTHRCVSPLFDKSRDIVAFVTISDVKVLYSLKPTEKPAAHGFTPTVLDGGLA